MTFGQAQRPLALVNLRDRPALAARAGKIKKKRRAAPKGLPGAFG